MRLTPIALAALIAVAPLSAVEVPAPSAHAPTEARQSVKTWTVRESSGRIEAKAVRRVTQLGAAADSMSELQVSTSEGSFTARTQFRNRPDRDGNLFTAEIRSSATGRKIEWFSGPPEQNHDKPDLKPQMILKHQMVRAGEVSLPFSELNTSQLLAGKLTAKELAAFRDSVPEELRNVCELLVRASDLLQVDESVLLLASLAAPKDTRMDASRQGWYITDEKVSSRSIPIDPQRPTTPLGQGESEERISLGHGPGPKPPATKPQ